MFFVPLREERDEDMIRTLKKLLNIARTFVLSAPP